MGRSVVDRTGQAYGRLTVVKRADHIPGGAGSYAYWWCECSCGRACVVASGNSLGRSNTKSCGCLADEARRKARLSLIGKRFGRLTVVKLSSLAYGRGSYWWCTCECGSRSRLFSGSELNRGNTKSCGCLTREIVSQRNRTHGKSDTVEWKTWQAMRKRCTNPLHPHYPSYGGRGIRVCDAWINSFETFLKDMGHKPSPEYSLDRLNNEGHYEPANCAWRTSRQQQNNRRTTVQLTHQGQTMSLAYWAERTGIKHTILYRRIREGWSVERALTTPVRAQKSPG